MVNRTFQLSALNTAYVEVRIGDRVGYTSTVKHLKRNPNFIRPLITLDNVVLPQQLCYAPPLTFSLHQLSPVPFISAVAACNVTSFAKYLRKVPKEYVRDEVGWSNFDRVLRDEENIEARMRLSAKEGANETIDWWSKYYASIGDEQRAPGFAESGIEKLTVFECALEEADGYREFSDFMDTFIFRELSSGKCDVSALPPPRAALRAKIYIRRKGGNSSHTTYPPLETYPDSTRCLLRVYVIRAFDLVSRRSDGTCDPYIAIRCGNRKISARKAARFKDLNPIFGRMLEMVVSIPRDKNLVISVLDRHRIFSGFSSFISYTKFN
ncbi:unnamed protein product [Toxocara canis]|uniref:C2 domain-containing protein n=1 Tax=Toxocara canis TaxID=6265 RepID=A0A183V4U6_TOXCA|nr:unnamed protein product [Toxocara canis]